LHSKEAAAGNEKKGRGDFEVEVEVKGKSGEKDILSFELSWVNLEWPGGIVLPKRWTSFLSAHEIGILGFGMG
jgi:hypothetical protein